MHCTAVHCSELLQGGTVQYNIVQFNAVHWTALCCSLFCFSWHMFGVNFFRPFLGKVAFDFLSLYLFRPFCSFPMSLQVGSCSITVNILAARNTEVHCTALHHIVVISTGCTLSSFVPAGSGSGSHCTLHTLYYTLYTAHCTVHTIHCPL